MTDLSSDQTEWKKEYKLIKQKISLLDKEVFRNFTYTKTTTMKNDIQNLVDIDEKKEFERQIEREELFGHIAVIRKDIKNLKGILKVYNKTPEYLNKIQILTEGIEDKINKMKEKESINFDKLLDEETQLFHEISIINDKLDTYETNETEKKTTNASFPNKRSSSVRTYAPKAKIVKNENEYIINSDEEHENNNNEDEDEDNDYNAKRDIPKKQQNPIEETINNGLEKKLRKVKDNLANIESQIENNGGKYCGWDAEDHTEFLKIRSKHKNNMTKIAFLNDCICLLPLFSEDQIKMHIEKFQLFLELEEKKKEMVNEYKLTKDLIKKQVVEAINKEDQRMKEIQKKRLDPMKEKEERDKMKEKIKEWKVTKIAKTYVEKENEDYIQLEKKREKEMQNLAKREEMQRRIQEFKEQKEIEKIRKKEKEEYEKNLQKRHLTPQELMRLKEKEDELLKKKQDLLAKEKEKKMQAELKKQKMLETASLNYAYVEPKLNEQTKAAQCRQREKYDPKTGTSRIADTFGGALVRTTGRALAGWRQGM